MSRDPDDELRRVYRAQRQADEKSASPFRRVLEQGAGRRIAPPRRRVWIRSARLATIGATTLVAAFLFSTWGLHRPPAAPMAPAPAARIETWQPATAFLLDPSFDDLLDTVPALPRPVPDYSPLLRAEKGHTP